MSWRPEGLPTPEELLKNHNLYDPAAAFSDRLKVNLAYDAMLKALRKTGEHYGKGRWTDDSTFCVETPGTVVFIPDGPKGSEGK